MHYWWKINIRLVFTLFAWSPGGPPENPSDHLPVGHATPIFSCPPDSLLLLDFYRKIISKNCCLGFDPTIPVAQWPGVCIAAVETFPPTCFWGIDLDDTPHCDGNSPEGGCVPTADQTGNGKCLVNTVLPNPFPAFPGLTMLHLSKNRQLSGPIPDFSGLSDLEVLRLNNCNFTGTIPASLSSLSKLYDLHLHDNQLSGAIPPQLSQLRGMQTIALRNNNLKGVIPDLSVTGVINLSLNGNKFTFEDFLPNLAANLKINSFVFSNQQPVMPDTVLCLVSGCADTINLQIDEGITTNIYTWEKDGEPFRTIEGSNKLIFTPVGPEDAGVYTCRIRNRTMEELRADALILSTGKIQVVVCQPEIEEITDTLCTGEFLIVNGTRYDERRPGGCEVIRGDGPATSCTDCKIIQVNLRFGVEDDFGFADADSDAVACTDRVTLNATLPAGVTGRWTPINTSAQIAASELPTTLVTALQPGVNTFRWSLSVGECLDYAADTVLITREMVPEAHDDAFTSVEGQLLEASVLDTDSLYGAQNWTIELTSPLPTGLEFNPANDGRFTYQAPLPFQGTVQFNYRLFNPACPAGSGEATVTIRVNPETDLSIAFPDVITPNGDGYNDTFIIPAIELDRDAFPNSWLVIESPWGQKVFEARNYQNDWGGWNQAGQQLTDGTYYYVFDFGKGRPPVKGRIAILYSQDR